MSSPLRFHRHARQCIDSVVREGYAALAHDKASCHAFTSLLAHVRACSTLLRPHGDAPEAVRVLVNLARYHREFLRDLTAWPGGADSMHRLVHSLACHLLARYPVPIMMTGVWYGKHTPSRRPERRWWISHASGTRFRDIPDMPLKLTRKMERLLLASPAHMPMRAAMRRAELLGLDAPRELVDAVLTTDLAHDLEHGEYWRETFHFFINHWQDIGAAKIKPIVDFLYAVRLRTAEQMTPTGLVFIPPPEPTFTLAGRTPRSLQKQIDEWHRELGMRRSGLDAHRVLGRTWATLGLGEFRFHEPPQADGAEAVDWLIDELLHTNELRAEGRTLHHCVASYEWRCVQGLSRIFSLRRRSGDGPAQPRYTVEVDPRTRTIVQIRGHRNALAVGQPRRILGMWAQHMRLTMAEHA